MRIHSSRPLSVFPFSPFFAFALTLFTACIYPHPQLGATTFLYPGSKTEKWGQVAAKAFNNTAIRTMPLPPLSPRDILDLLKHGVFDVVMMNAFHLAEELPDVSPLSYPFVFKNITTARKEQARLQKDLNAATREEGFRIEGFTWSAGTFVSFGDCISSPRQLLNKRMVGGYAVHRELFRRLGARSIPFKYFRPHPQLSTEVGFFSSDYILDNDLVKSTSCVTDPTKFTSRMIPYLFVSAKPPPSSTAVPTRNFITLSEADEIAKLTAVLAAYKKARKRIAVLKEASFGEWRDVAQQLYLGTDYLRRGRPGPIEDFLLK